MKKELMEEMLKQVRYQVAESVDAMPVQDFWNKEKYNDFMNNLRGEIEASFCAEELWSQIDNVFKTQRKIYEEFVEDLAS